MDEERKDICTACYQHLNEKKKRNYHWEVNFK